MSSTTDYDVPRRGLVDVEVDSLEELKARRATPPTDVDEPDTDEAFELPGAELSDEELTVTVVPMRANEFRCSRCFLVQHRNQLAGQRDGKDICRECA